MFSRGDIWLRTDLTLLMLTMILPTPLLTLLTPEKALGKPRCHQLTGMSPLCGQILWYLRPVCIKHAFTDGHIHTHSSIHTHAVGGWTVYTQTTAQASTCRRLDIPCHSDTEIQGLRTGPRILLKKLISHDREKIWDLSLLRHLLTSLL